MATIYLATMGRRGLQEVALQNLQKSHYAARKIAELNGYEMKYRAPFFNEFVIKTPVPASEVVERLIEKGMVAGLPLEGYYPDMRDSLLMCVTETARKEAIDRLVAEFDRIR